MLFFPLFYGTVVAASFFFGYLRIYTGSIWPASIAHCVHNAAWNILGAVTLTTASPVLVNVYLVGDFGLLILIGVVIGAIWVGHRFKSGMDETQSGAEVPRVAPAHPSAPAAPIRFTEGARSTCRRPSSGRHPKLGCRPELARPFCSPECVEGVFSKAHRGSSAKIVHPEDTRQKKPIPCSRRN